MANRADLPIAYFGILRGGMVAVPMNPRSTADEIGRMLADAKAKVVLCDATGAPPVREAVAGYECDVVVDGVEPNDAETTFDEFIGEAADAEPVAPRDAEALAAILYTSGASGHPRGVMLSHRALIANVEQAASVEPPLVTSDDRMLGLLPMFHIYGLNAVLGYAMRAGARVVMVDGFDPAGLLATVRDEGITNLPLAPPVIAAWAGRDGLREALAGVRVVVSGASALDPDLAALFAESSGHHVEQGYGMTEASPVIAVTLASRREPGAAPKQGSVGHSLPGIEVRTVDAHGNDVENGDLGELLVHGDNLFSGYWPDGADGPDADGWYRTGDVGFADDDGDLTLVDRLRELVIVSGFNVYPSEVEDVIKEVGGVAEVAVVGVPDEKTGEGVVAFVVPTSDAPGEEELAAEITSTVLSAWPGSSIRLASSSSGICRIRPPARSRRVGSVRSLAARPSISAWHDAVRLRHTPLTHASSSTPGWAAICAISPWRSSLRCAPIPGTPGPRCSSNPTRSLPASSLTRCR